MLNVMSTRGRDATRIMVADDDSLIRTVLRFALEGAGYEVSETDSGDGVIADTAADAADLIILDARMPGPGLSTTLATLRLQSVPVLVLSGDAIVAKGSVTPGLAYLTKPVDMDELLTTISLLLSGATHSASAHD